MRMLGMVFLTLRKWYRIATRLSRSVELSAIVECYYAISSGVHPRAVVVCQMLPVWYAYAYSDKVW